MVDFWFCACTRVHCVHARVYGCMWEGGERKDHVLIGMKKERLEEDIDIETAVPSPCPPSCHYDNKLLFLIFRWRGNRKFRLLKTRKLFFCSFSYFFSFYFYPFSVNEQKPFCIVLFKYQNIMTIFFESIVALKRAFGVLMRGKGEGVGSPPLPLPLPTS